jgi:ABC-type Fe3+ transport system permease subunit
MTLAPALESRVRADSGVAGHIRGRRFPAQKVTYVVLGLGVLGLVLFPVVMLVLQSLNVGVPSQIVPTVLGFTNFTAGTLTPTVLWQTLLVAALATVGALVIGTGLAWVVTRTDVPGRALIERLAQVPYYISPIVGALASGRCSRRRARDFSTRSSVRSVDPQLCSTHTPRGASHG